MARTERFMSYSDRTDLGEHDVHERLEVALLRVGAIALGRHWRHADLCSPYWRLYLDRQDGARILPRDRPALALRAGRRYLVPPWVHFATESREGVDHVFCHFDLLGLPGTVVRACFPAPVTLPPEPPREAALLALGDRIASGEPITPPSICLWKAEVWAGLASAIAALPPADRRRCLQPIRREGPLRGAIDLIQADLAGDLGNRALAARCGTSADHLIRLFRRHLGQTPGAYVQERRLAAAARELAYADAPIETIARACGFADRFSFSKAFARRMGAPPAAWRRTYRDGRGGDA
jgi:AraC-like DNA-binding protein